MITGESGKERCKGRCLASLLFTHRCKQHFESAEQADLGTAHLCALSEQHQERFSSTLQWCPLMFYFAPENVNALSSVCTRYFGLLPMRTEVKKK